MEDLQVPQNSWGEELRNYEHVKRRVVNEGLLRGPQIRVTDGQMKRAERVFDPLLQRYRNGATELEQRTLEEHERVAHLNRAQDIQVMREQPFDIIRHESKLEAVAPGLDPMRLGDNPRRPQGNPGNSFPDTALDYNLISNLPFDVHHWASPDRRPRCIERSPPRQRRVPAHDVKDFNIVTNRYVDKHEAKSKRDHTISLLDATYKDAVKNRFNPVVQQFSDPHYEECARTCDDARDVEVLLRAEAQMPPSYRGRETSHYNMISHERHDDGSLSLYDKAVDQRKDRYKNRYIMEHNWHAQDIKGDHSTNSRKLNRTAPERFEEQTRRGYDIVTNHSHGNGPSSQTLYAHYSQPKLTSWEQATSSSRPRSHCGRMSSTMPNSHGGMGRSQSHAGKSRQSHSSHGGNRCSMYAGRAG